MELKLKRDGWGLLILIGLHENNHLTLCKEVCNKKEKKISQWDKIKLMLVPPLQSLCEQVQQLEMFKKTT